MACTPELIRGIFVFMGIIKDLTGQVFGRLTVLSFNSFIEKRRTVWNCKCTCGKEVTAPGKNLTNGHKLSCGCLTKARFTHRSTGTRLHGIWGDMKNRCNNPRHKGFKNYGGRGIKICEDWQKDFSIFKVWAIANGYSETLKIERINNDGNYEPDNCKWATDLEQSFNKRTTRQIILFGETLNLLQAEQKYGISRDIIRSRINAGWDEIDVINPKFRFRKRIK
jgi:hypothetical protein